MFNSRPSICRGFTLLELMMVIGIIAILVGLLLPSLGHARGTTLEVACQVELHDNMMMVHMYGGDNREYWPMSFLPSDEPNTWVGPGDWTISGVDYFGVQSAYWPYAMGEDYGEDYLNPVLFCPADRETVDFITEGAEKHGLNAHQVVYASDRLLSLAFYVRPAFLRHDQAGWDLGAATVGTISSVRYPSSKAAMMDRLPFHDPNFISIMEPTPPPPYRLNVAAVDGSASARNTKDALDPVLFESPFTGDNADFRRLLNVYQTTKDGWLGRDW